MMKGEHYWSFSCSSLPLIFLCRPMAKKSSEIEMEWPSCYQLMETRDIDSFRSEKMPNPFKSENTRPELLKSSTFSGSSEMNEIGLFRSFDCTTDVTTPPPLETNHSSKTNVPPPLGRRMSTESVRKVEISNVESLSPPLLNSRPTIPKTPSLPSEGSSNYSLSTESLLSPPSASQSHSQYHTVNFGNAKITRVLAPQGGSGACIYACDVDGMQCALKEFTFDKKIDKLILERFSREIDMIETLEHPNIVKYLYHTRRPTYLRLFMTRYESTLRQEIRIRESEVFQEICEPFTCREIISLLYDISKGLKYLHENRILHRDLKTDNIFINFGERGNVTHAVIGDFDSAKRLATTLHAKTIIGTTNYMFNVFWISIFFSLIRLF
jgi:hypothetical protein